MRPGTMIATHTCEAGIVVDADFGVGDYAHVRVAVIWLLGPIDQGTDKHMRVGPAAELCSCWTLHIWRACSQNSLSAACH